MILFTFFWAFAEEKISTKIIGKKNKINCFMVSSSSVLRVGILGFRADFSPVFLKIKIPSADEYSEINVSEPVFLKPRKEAS